MAIKRFSIRVLAGMTLAAGFFSGQAKAQMKAEDVLARKPIQAGVNVTTPTGADLAGCKAEQLTWAKPATGAAPTGIVVKDANGRLVRQFIDTTGRNNPNIFSYYLNGVEAYREIDVNGDGKPDQFRWLGANGTKWGLDKDNDGIVDQWYVLSAEELSQELFAVFLSNDPRRLAPLLTNVDELKGLGLPADEAAKLGQKSAGVPKKLETVVPALKLAAGAKWVHIELGVPSATPGDSVGSTADIVVHKNGSVLFDKGDGKSLESYQTGEMIQVGRVWKLVDGPAAGSAHFGGTHEDTPTIPQEIVGDVKELQEIKYPAEPTPAALVKYHTDRAVILERIVSKTKGAAQEPWLKQTIDSYASAAESGALDSPAMQRLKQWNEVLAKTPGSAATPYAAFRLAAAEYAVRLSPESKPDVMKVQEWWRGTLEGFVKAFPTAEDAPEAMLRLAVAYEFAGKDGDAKAKEWYDSLAKNFPSHSYAAKAQGASKRLTSEGQPFALAGQQIGGGGAFDMSKASGKIVVVYYWASWGRDIGAELKALAEIAKTYGPKGVELVTINLDDEAAKGVAALNAAQVPGTHLHAAGGLDKSPLATAYGIQMVPHVFVIGKDGKVVNRNAQTGPVLKDEIEKLVK